jgi:hypothetical protein
MAWIEQTGQHTWRVHYPHSGGHSHYGTVSGFTTAKAARDHANDLESDQRRGQWIDPASTKTTMTAWSLVWVETLDVETRTEENYLVEGPARTLRNRHRRRHPRRRTSHHTRRPLGRPTRHHRRLDRLPLG